jgi:hypothetical protein
LNRITERETCDCVWNVQGFLSNFPYNRDVLGISTILHSIEKTFVIFDNPLSEAYFSKICPHVSLMLLLMSFNPLNEIYFFQNHLHFIISTVGIQGAVLHTSCKRKVSSYECRAYHFRNLFLAGVYKRNSRREKTKKAMNRNIVLTSNDLRKDARNVLHNRLFLTYS